jgi:phosphate starvation-inducible protein PhoH and related proteins
MGALQFSFDPVDNKRLAKLCGAFDENLRQIETALEVVIVRRGEHFSIEGGERQTQLARDVLQNFYREAKHDISLESLQLGLIEAMKATPEGVGKSSGEAQIKSDFVPLLVTPKTEIHGRTPRQNDYLQAIQLHDITFGVGPAGTGKTYLAVACAVDALQRDAVKRLVLVRPAVEAGERLGFLPGDLAQKVDPYLRPLYDALYDLMGPEKVVRAFERGIIEIAPLAYMRGRTINHSFIILDEAQNTTPEQMKMFLTRIGFGSKAVITGDVTQIDLARGQKSGLIEARTILKDVRGIAFSEFLAEDVVRHPLVQKIVAAYERHEREKKPHS